MTRSLRAAAAALLLLLTAGACAAPERSGARERALPGAAPDTPAATCRIHGRVDRQGMQAWVGVFGPAGRLAGDWITIEGFPFAFTDLPAGTPLIVATWSPMAASDGAVEILQAAGTPAYTAVFERLAPSLARTLEPDAAAEVVLAVQDIEQPVVQVTLQGLDRSVPAPAFAEVKVGLHVDASNLGEGHGCVQREWWPGEPIPSGPIAFPIECDCGLELGWEARVTGYKHVKRRIPLPPDPGPITLTIALEKLDQGTHASVVHADTGTALPGAFVYPYPLEERPDAGGDSGFTEREFESGQSWDRWLDAVPVDGEARFALSDRRLAERVIAVVPGVGCSAWTELRGRTAPVTLEVVPGNVIHGVVTDATTGEPAAGVRVALERHRLPVPVDDLSMGGIGAPGDATIATSPTRAGTGVVEVTDGEGRYRFAGVPPEWYVRPVVLADRRADPHGMAVPVDYEGRHDEDGQFVPSDVATWLDQRRAAGELIRFTDVGQSAARDLSAVLHRGRWVRLTVRGAERSGPIEMLQIEHRLKLSDRAATPQDVSEREGLGFAQGVSLSSEVTVADGRRAEFAVRSHHWFWHDEDSASAGARAVRLYLRQGDNALKIEVEGFQAVTLIEAIGGDGEPLEREIVLER